MNSRVRNRLSTIPLFEAVRPKPALVHEDSLVGNQSFAGTTQMPYGIPWHEAEMIYPCVKCRYETLSYTRYCPSCGEKQPTELRKQAIGCARQITSKREPEEVQASLDEFNGFAVRLWSYGVSHCELQLHFYKKGGERMILMCASTREIQLPTVAWAADLELVVEPGKYDDSYIVRDRKLGHYVRCNMVVAYFGFDSSFLGDGIGPK